MPPRLLCQEKKSPKELDGVKDIWISYVKKITKFLFNNDNIIEDINPYAAFPSLHMAWVSWSLLNSLMISNYKLILFMIIHFILTANSTILLCHHYPIDLFCGFLIAFFVFIIM